MGMATLVLGKSGSGKSTSLRNFEQDEVLILNVGNKPLPFRKKLGKIPLRAMNDKERYSKIKSTISGMQNKYKCFVIDDSQFLMSFALFDKVNERGYDKFTTISVEFKELLDFIQLRTNDDVTVYLLHHVEVDELGKYKAKTVGKMMDNHISIESLFTAVIQSETEMGSYYFRVHNDGQSTVKTPLGMFDKDTIDNDLKEVDRVIREYYEMPPLKVREVQDEKPSNN